MQGAEHGWRPRRRVVAQGEPRALGSEKPRHQAWANLAVEEGWARIVSRGWRTARRVRSGYPLAVSWRQALVRSGGAFLVAGLVVWVNAAGLLRPLELPLADFLQRRLPRRPATRVAAVLIDEAALATFGRWPWARERLAEVVRAAGAAGAAGVVLDVLLVEPAEGDDVLAAALAARPTALVCAFSETAPSWLLPVEPLRTAATLGHGAVELDADGVARRIASTKQAGGLVLPALALAAARLQQPSLAIPVGVSLVPGFRSPPAAVPRLGAVEVVQGGNSSVFSGRVVFIGVSGVGLGDHVVTPVTRGEVPEPGVLVHAAATESLLTGDLLHPLPPLLCGLVALLLALAATAVERLGWPVRVPVQAGLIVSPIVLAAAALYVARCLAPAVTLTVSAIVVVAGLEVHAGVRAWRVAERIPALLGAALGRGVAETRRTLAGQLELAETLALEAARRRVASDGSAGVLAHELKTPLTSVRGLAQMVRDMELAPVERRRAAQLLVREADRLAAMVERLTELERLAHRPFETHAQRLDLSALVQSRATTLASGFGRSVCVEVTPGLAVWGDPRLLDTVMDNLLGNAFKFSPPNSEVKVRVAAHGNLVKVQVSDSGTGIPAEEQEAIFQRFFRGSSAAGREGMGLGLALVREVVTWHRGSVEVASRPGEGSTFEVTLPLA